MKNIFKPIKIENAFVDDKDNTLHIQFREKQGVFYQMECIDLTFKQED